MPWWYTQNEERLDGSRETREEAIATGTHEYCGEPFLIAFGERFKYQALHFDIDRIAEDFDDANCDYSCEDEYPSTVWSDESCRELESALTATMDAWLDKHGYRDASAIDVGPYERISPPEKEG